MVWAVPLSLATTDGIDSLSFPADTEMFHFSACRSTETIYSSRSNTELPVLGFPIRESPDIMRVCRSPELIAACCALHRLMTPRHPSSAVTGLCKHSSILGVYLTFLHNYISVCLNFQRTKLNYSGASCIRLAH